QGIGPLRAEMDQLAWNPVGCRQGCPSSSLLFAIAIEPLAIAIRSDTSIAGIKFGTSEHKLSLYADDLLLYRSDPYTSVPPLLKCLKEYSAVSGYKLNYTKSEILPLNIQDNNIRYFELNGPKLLKTIRDDLNRWTNLPLSLWGRAEVLKMNGLPRLAFLFSAIPLEIPQKWFIEIDKLFPLNKAGLGTPDVYAYYLSYNVKTSVVKWRGERRNNLREAKENRFVT
uniref:Reverse transcriptase domain-containing protein n=1 Tax=Seriola lalandi dorsalis TaxID=1841481 RepID=A0A3B4WQI6_SERLL